MSLMAEPRSPGKPAAPLQTMSLVVELNVGGELYTTTVGTLKKFPGSKLAEMFNTTKPPRPDSQGRFFIDRPGTHFRPILEYLRSGQLPKESIPEVYREAQFYEIQPLVKLLEETPQIYGEQVARKQFLLRVPGYNENLELMIRIARAEAVAARCSGVVVCAVRTEEDAARSLDTLQTLETDKRSVVKFGPWKASPGITDLLDCVKMDIEAQGYCVSYQSYVAEKVFRLKSSDYFYKFTFTWW